MASNPPESAAPVAGWPGAADVAVAVFIKICRR